MRYLLCLGALLLVGCQDGDDKPLPWSTTPPEYRVPEINGAGALEALTLTAGIVLLILERKRK